MPDHPLLTCSITVGKRTFSEVLDYELEQEGWEQWRDDWTEDPLNSSAVPSWPDYIRPVEVDEDQLEQLNLLGGHILYGWVEYISQSDYSPMFSLTEFNDDDEVIYKLSHS